MNMPFGPEAMQVFLQTLLIMLQGMTGIFFFMGLFFLLIVGLGKLFPVKEQKN